MPVYYFTCECGKVVRKLQPKPEAPTCECGKEMLRTSLRVPSSQVTETLDNGFMPKRVVRPADAERLHQERAANDPRLKEDDIV